MAIRPPFVAIIPGIARTVGGNTPEVDAANQNRALEDIQREMVKGQEHSDLDPKNKSVRGLSNDQTVLAKFKKADEPLFIPHDFGYTVRNWVVVDKCGKGDIYRPVGRKYAPNKLGIWLACSEGACECRIRMDGQEAQK